MTVTNYGAPPFQPGMTSDSFTPDQLIAGDLKVVTDNGTITGGAVYKRGTVLGQITVGTVGAAVAGGGNTGNGTVTLITAGAKAKVGTYTIKFKSATTYEVLDPNGAQLADATALGAYTDPQIGFTVTAGGTAFVAGDSFTIAVSGSSKYTIATSAAVDGSQNPVTVLVDDVDTTGGDVQGGIYRQAELNGNALILGSGITLSAAKAALEAVPSTNIYIKSPVSAADPS